MTTLLKAKNYFLELEHSLNKFGIVELKPCHLFPNDPLIKETTVHRVFTLKITDSSVTFFSIEQGQIIYVLKEDVLNYCIDDDWRFVKEWTIMRHFSDIYNNQPIVGDYISMADVAIDVMDVISDQYLKNIFEPRIDEDENIYTNVLAGELINEPGKRVFRVGIIIPYKEYDARKHHSLINHDGVPPLIKDMPRALNELGCFNDDALSSLRETVLNISNYLTKCEPHVNYVDHKNWLMLDVDHFYLKMDFYYSFSRIFASKGSVHRALINLRKALNDFADDNFKEFRGE